MCSHNLHSTRKGAGRSATALAVALLVLASGASPEPAQNVQISFDPMPVAQVSPMNGSGVASPDKPPPRILTLLTTYNKRTPYIKAYKEAVASRGGGDEPLIFVTSDEEDEDPDGVIDYKYGEPAHHRLLAALTEAYTRYEGQFDWVAVGDDDTVFMYNRARALLKGIDHTQPVAIARVDGLKKSTGRSGHGQRCYSPEEKRNSSDTFAAKGCCLDFTSPCEVPVTSNNARVRWYGPGGLSWPYGGVGTFISAGLMEAVAMGEGVEGWKRCTLEFGHGNTDCQLAMCMAGRGLSFSDYKPGFFNSRTCEPAELDDILSSQCQVLGVHLGLRHLLDNSTYTPERFGNAAAAVWDADDKWVDQGDDYLAEMCPEAWASVSVWN